MPCDTQRLPEQTVAERMAEVRKAIANIAKLIALGKVKPVVGQAGGIAFTGLSDDDRARMTDACIWRQIMRTGSAQAKMKIAAAEQLAGRSVDKAVVHSGLHSHNGGQSWSTH